MPREHKLGDMQVREAEGKIDACPRCEEKQITYENIPQRKIKMAPEYNNLEIGDKRRTECGYCGWWREARWDGEKWVWKTAPSLNAHQRQKLNERIRIMKIKRRRQMK